MVADRPSAEMPDRSTATGPPWAATLDAPFETRLFLANTEQGATRRAAEYAAAHVLAERIFWTQEWDERRGTLRVAFRLLPAPAAGSSPWPLGGWVPGPPRPQRRDRRMLLSGIALAVVVVIVGGLGLRALDAPSASTAAPPPLAAEEAGTLPRLEAVDCRFEPPSWRDVTCHDLLVPEDRGVPGTGVVRLHVATYAAVSERPSAVPLLYLEGGPGGAALLDGEDFAAFPFAGRDLVVLDQRGTGHSTPSLDCPEVDPVDVWAVDGGRAERRALDRCRERLLAAGISFGAYDTAAGAADIADLRRALGYPEWDMYGISYGTRLALAVMRDHPEGVRSVVLDSVLPPDVDLYALGARNASRAFDRLFAACREEPRCLTRFPDLRTRFYELIERLDRYPEYAERHGERWMIDGTTLVIYLFERLYASEAVPALPATIGAAEDGDFDEVVDFLEEGAGFPSFGTSFHRSIAEAMHHAVSCADEVAYSSRLDEQEASAIVPEPVAAYFDSGWIRDLCEDWAIPAGAPIETQPVASGIPALLLSGEFDPITPPEWARAAASHLSRSHVYELRGSAHGVAPYSRCAELLITTFLDDPLVRPDDTCVAELDRAPFD